MKGNKKKKIMRHENQFKTIPLRKNKNLEEVISKDCAK